MKFRKIYLLLLLIPVTLLSPVFVGFVDQFYWFFTNENLVSFEWNVERGALLLISTIGGLFSLMVILTLLGEMK